MELSEKLQQLRKKNDLTQEQLAQQLFVTRTAVSKWESGKGYPNIGSLKSLSKLFSVSIDDLLSGEELITLAASENRANMRKVFGLICGVVDLMAVAFIFLPFYGQRDGAHIRSVTLLDYRDSTAFLSISYWTILLLMVAFGVAEVLSQHYENEKWLKIGIRVSLVLHTIAILIFTASNQPYVTAFLFLFFICKLLMLFKRNKTA